MNRNKFGTSVVLAALALLGACGVARAANPATISVTVTIQNLSVSATGPVAFGTVTAGSENVSIAGSSVLNNGNVTETFSLSLTSPIGWTAVQAAPAAPEEFALLAQFNASAPTAASFSYADHALSTTAATSTATRFAGSQTGQSVAAAGARTLWFRFNAPPSTSVTTEQTITVTVTAAAS